MDGRWSSPSAAAPWRDWCPSSRENRSRIWRPYRRKMRTVEPPLSRAVLDDRDDRL